MALDPTIKTAVEAAVVGEGQSAQLAKKILVWLEAVIAGNEELRDPESAQRHLEVLFGAVEVATKDPE